MLLGGIYFLLTSESQEEDYQIVVATPAAGSSGSGSGNGGKFCGPTAKSFKWEHILSGHTPDGERAKQSGQKSVFENMTESQIKAAVIAAWKNRQLVRSQFTGFEEGNRQVYRGVDPISGYTIVMWFNPTTCEVDTAYPIK